MLGKRIFYGGGTLRLVAAENAEIGIARVLGNDGRCDAVDATQLGRDAALARERFQRCSQPVRRSLQRGFDAAFKIAHALDGHEPEFRRFVAIRLGAAPFSYKQCRQAALMPGGEIDGEAQAQE